MDVQSQQLPMEIMERLIGLTNYDRLMQMCEENKMLSDNDVRNIEKISDDRERHRELLKICNSTASDLLLAILSEEGLTEAYTLLKSSFDGSCLGAMKRQLSIDGNNNNDEVSSSSDQDELDYSPAIRLEPFNGTVARRVDVRKARTFGKHPKIDVYRMRSRQRGVFFLVNIIDFDRGEARRRNGAEQDRDNLIALFQGIGGFTIFYYENITQVQFKQLLDELIESRYLRTADCFVMSILTHGDHSQGLATILFRDMSYMKLDDVMERFQNKNCRHLLGKPKVFLFPFCRGDRPDHGSFVARPARPMSSRQIEHDAGEFNNDVYDVHQVKWPTYSDILICYATVLGFMTHRDVQDGSWYVQNIVTLWAEHAHDTHVEDLAKMVGSETMKLRSDPQQSLQTSSWESKGFHKILYLNPGLMED